MIASSAAALPPPVSRGTPEFHRMMLALATVGFSAFALLYGVQPLLPVFTVAFDRTPAEASLALSIATGVLASALLFAGLVADRVERRRMMTACVVAASLLTFAVAFAPNWTTLLAARALTGLALAGVPAVAVTYIAEEVDSPSMGLAVGLHIAGNVFGGMTGRLVAGVMADHWGWRGAMAVLAATGLLAGLLLRLTLPASRRFVPRHRTLATAFSGFAVPWRDAAMPWLFMQAFVLMGCFITLYNYIGFRLLAAPYSLSQTVVGLIFTLYLLGIVSSPWMGDLAERLGRRKVLWLAVLGLLIGVALTVARPLALVIAGVGLSTFAFFGAHSVASSWVSRRAGEHRAQATSIYMVFYYLGGSVVGYFGGIAWSAAGWIGVAILIGGLLAAALGGAIRLAFLPPPAWERAGGCPKTGQLTPSQADGLGLLGGPAHGAQALCKGDDAGVRRNVGGRGRGPIPPRVLSPRGPVA